MTQVENGGRSCEHPTSSADIDDDGIVYVTCDLCGWFVAMNLAEYDRLRSYDEKDGRDQ